MLIFYECELVVVLFLGFNEFFFMIIDIGEDKFLLDLLDSEFLWMF